MKRLYLIMALLLTASLSAFGWTQLEQTGQLYSRDDAIYPGAIVGDYTYATGNRDLIVYHTIPSDTLPAPIEECNRIYVEYLNDPPEITWPYLRGLSSVGDSLLFVFDIGGIRIFSLANPAAPKPEGVIRDDHACVNAMAIYGDYAYFSRNFVHTYTDGETMGDYYLPAPGFIEMGSITQLMQRTITSLYQTPPENDSTLTVHGRIQAAPYRTGNTLILTFNLSIYSRDTSLFETRLQTYDVSVPQTPALLKDITLFEERPDSGYNWHYSGFAIKDSVGYSFKNNQLYLFDLRGLAEGQVSVADSLPLTGVDTPVIRGDHLYVPSSVGLSIFRIDEPFKLTAVDTVLKGVGCTKPVFGEGTFASWRNCRLSVFNIESPDLPVEVARSQSEVACLHEIVVVDSIAYVGSWQEDWLRVIDIKSLQNPREVNVIPMHAWVYWMQRIEGGFATRTDTTLFLYDCSNPYAPVIADSVTIPRYYDSAWQVIKRDRYVYTFGTTFRVYLSSPPSPMKLISTKALTLYDCAIVGNTLYAQTSSWEEKRETLHLFDLTDPAAPKLRADSLALPYPCSITTDNEKLYIVQHDRVDVYSIEAQGLPVFLYSCVMRDVAVKSYSPSECKVYNGILSLHRMDFGLEIYRISDCDSADQYRIDLGDFSWFDANQYGVVWATWLNGLKTVAYPGFTSVLNDNRELPVTMEILSAFPNPFNPSTTIIYRVEHAGPIQLDVVDINGRVVTTLAEGEMSAGRYSMVWEAGDVPAGVYLVRLTDGAGRVAVEKVVLVK